MLQTSAIEGELLDPSSVRSSLARRLGVDIGGPAMVDRHIEGVVDRVLDATSNPWASLTKERLFGWHAALFPSGRSGLARIRVGAWRGDAQDPMQVVSGPPGRERVHYEAPPASRIEEEMARLLDGFEGHLTSSKWAVMTWCSPDTALRDLQQLVALGILRRSDAGGRSTRYLFA